MSFKKDLKLLLKPYYYVNIILSVSYVVAKKLPFVCTFMFPHSEAQCELDSVICKLYYILWDNFTLARTEILSRIWPLEEGSILELYLFLMEVCSVFHGGNDYTLLSLTYNE